MNPSPEPSDLERALEAVDKDTAWHWPTVAAVLAHEYRSLLDRVLSPNNHGWQPIETMPKDRPVLVWAKWEGEVGGKEDRYHTHIAENLQVYGGDFYASWAYDATHWMPLPEPP